MKITNPRAVSHLALVSRTGTIACAWCGAPVEPRAPNVDGSGGTYPRDADGDVTCTPCLALPGYHVPTVHA